MGKALPRKLVAAVLERDGGLCVVKGEMCLGEAQVAHHRVNRGAGGARSLDGMSNLLGSCSPCNGWIEDSTGEDREMLIARGIRVIPGRTHAHSAQKARDKPVWYPDGRVFYLDDDGGRRKLDTQPY